MSSDNVSERQNEKARKKGCGIILTLALLAFLLVAVPTVCYLIFTARAASQVETELAKIRAQGYPATASELDAYYEYPPAAKDATQLWLAAVKPLEGEAYEASCGELPIVGYCEDGEKIIPPPGEEWEDLEAVEEFLAKYAESLELLHKAAEKGGAARYPANLSKGLLDMDISFVQSLRSGARVLSLQAHVRAHRGDARGVAESIRAMFLLGQSLESEPTFYSQLVRMALQNMACELLRKLLPHVEFPDEDLVSLRAAIGKIDNDAAFERAMIGERAMAVSLFQNPASITELDDSTSARVAARFGVRNDDLLLYLRLIDDVISATRTPCPQRLDDLLAVENELDSFFGSTIDRFRYTVTLLTMPGVGRGGASAFARGDATIRMADAVLAVEQFSRKNDRLPEKLDELVPEFLDEVPLDPFDGNPLRYALREDAYVIYSIGRDRVDDGGQVLGKDEFGDYVENRDLVFPVKLP